MSFGPLSPGASIGGHFRTICTWTPVSSGVDSYGQGILTAGVAVQYLACNLQQMSSSRSMIYKAQNAEGMFDLYLPLRREGQTGRLSINVADRFTIDGLTYQAVGEGVREGTSGFQRVPVERLEVSA